MVRTGNVFLRVLNPGRERKKTNSQKKRRADFTSCSAPQHSQHLPDILTPVSAGSAGPPRRAPSQKHTARLPPALEPPLSRHPGSSLVTRGLLDTLSPALLLSQTFRHRPSDTARAVCDVRRPHTDLSVHRTGGPGATPGSRSFLASQAAVSAGSC